jgi:hypothetical protein
MQFQAAAPWASEQFGPAELGDRRLTSRLVSYAARAAADPSASIPAQCGSWKQTKGAYRLFDNDATTHAAVVRPHLEATRAAAARAGVVLHVSDTTTLSFDHPHTQGLGPPGSGGGGRGMLLHNTLAVDVSGGIDRPPTVLGLSHQQLWTRTTERKKAPESAKWADAIHAVGAAPAGGATVVHVGDAESDCWEALAACEALPSVGHVTRACQDRLVSPAGGGGGGGDDDDDDDDDPRATPTAKLFDLVRAQAPLGGKFIWARGRGNEEARLVKLLVAATRVTIRPPKNWSDKKHRGGRPKPAPLVRWAVRVWEADPPAGREGIEWVLLTDRPVADLAAALLVAFWYSCRWLVEEYHKCLKTGCRVEGRQLDHVDRLEPLVGVLGVVAVRLLQLKHRARVNPDAPARDVVPATYVRTLAAWLNVSERMTARQFWRGTAQLGGFLGRRGDGDPGWQTVWRGWDKLQLLTDGAALAKRRR